MKRVFVLVIGALLLTTGSAFATPLYTGDTFSVLGVGNVPSLPADPGYYIWTNDADRYSWSIRWHGDQAAGTPVSSYYNWSGFIELLNNSGETLDEVLWESHDGAVPLLSSTPFGDFISFEAKAGPSWDGFDFTISGLPGNRIRFNLGSSWAYFADLTTSLADQESTAIFLGDAQNNPMVSINFDGMQSFEVPAPVPEPGTLLLLGFGLISLAILKRRKYC